ncbi:MAG TPA: DUF692 family protein [Cyclobacteriaceae bacterium]|nr:DUF692 family protein [Cyclobacteriaceae bacterium]
MSYSIGTTYEGKNLDYLLRIAPHVDHIEVSPDSISTNIGGAVTIHPDILKQLQWVATETNIDILLHGVGLSIGSYDHWNDEYLRLLDQLFNSIPSIKWHSEHLAYTRVNGENLGTMLALPRTDEVLDLVSERVNAIQERFKHRFLLENVASMLPDPGSKYSEAGFLNKITELTGCGLILDVYNMECDAYNFGFKIAPFFDELNINSVYELHVAGGAIDAEHDFKMDVHSRRLSQSTLDLTQKVFDRSPKNLKAVTYEILEEFVGNIGDDNIINELTGLRNMSRHEPQ